MRVSVPDHGIDQKEEFVFDIGVHVFYVLKAFYCFFVEVRVLAFSHQVVERDLECVGYFFCSINGGHGLAPFVFTGANSTIIL